MVRHRPEEEVAQSSAHLRPVWVLSVVEVIIINAQKGVRVCGSKIHQAQCLEVIYLLHQACERPQQPIGTV